MPRPDTDQGAPQEAADGGFRVALDVFEGPFDLLLQLIGRHELDITEVALSVITDEFIAHVAEMDTDDDLNRASEFIVVAATLLDMKLVSLLPQGDYVDAEDVAVLEARDLLFARLLQYRAFKQAGEWFAERMRIESVRHPRAAPLEPKYRERIPDLVWTTSLEDFAAIATLALAPRAIPTVGLDHLHAPLVSIREQAALLVERLRAVGALTFRELVADADERGVLVARFLAVLELYRRAAVELEQEAPLGELTVSWEAAEWNDDELSTLGADYDS
ncbi:ScpA family protein [Gulosibacter sp. 10]|uniref:segregation and condensation protein A n=1 Tax=Gulosibacter sp. 10 TaxID=1255570 RepID=UPI00097F12B2|nr:ScpA family protein [Gulosibacter sp. 10]SJM47433.1 Segregation and condensation protein A [Gulosibacter sp. 10]